LALKVAFDLEGWRYPVGMLSEQLKETVAEIRPGIIATASRDGRPNVSAKGSLRVLDDDHVVFADISSPRTVQNLRENPQVSILVLHPKSMRGCRIWGRGEVMDSGELFDKLSEEFAAKNMRVNNVVKVAVEEVQDSF
jgi:predicted pyridoxine 5'-phosphate oxidase superfamily flavin-nucleotide-binding protein